MVAVVFVPQFAILVIEVQGVKGVVTQMLKVP